MLASVLGVGLHSLANTEQVSYGKADLDRLREAWNDIPTTGQAQIQRISLDLELLPMAGKFIVHGHYQIVNTSAVAVDTILVRTGFDEHTNLSWNRDALLIRADSMLKYYAYAFEQPLAPGDTMHLDFSIRSLPNGYFIRNHNVLPNATFLRHDILPRLGCPLTRADHTAHYFGLDAERLHIRTQMQVPINQYAIAGRMNTQIDCIHNIPLIRLSGSDDGSIPNSES